MVFSADPKGIYFAVITIIGVFSLFLLLILKSLYPRQYTKFLPYLPPHTKQVHQVQNLHCRKSDDSCFIFFPFSGTHKEKNNPHHYDVQRCCYNFKGIHFFTPYFLVSSSSKEQKSAKYPLTLQN